MHPSVSVYIEQFSGKVIANTLGPRIILIWDNQTIWLGLDLMDSLLIENTRCTTRNEIIISDPASLDSVIKVGNKVAIMSGVIAARKELGMR